MVEYVKLQVDAVVVLKRFTEQDLRVVDQSKVVVGKMLYIVFNHNLDGFTYGTNEADISYLKPAGYFHITHTS